RVQEELGKLAAMVATAVPGLQPRTMALPLGVEPSIPALVRAGRWRHTTYHNEAVLLVGAEPAHSPWHKSWNQAAVPRIRSSSYGRVIHHAALICSDVEQTIRFYDGLLGFPLVELTENRDYPGSSHFFFDLGNSTLLGFFDFPGLGLQPAEERIGTVQHIAIGVAPDKHAMLQKKLDELGIPYEGPQRGIPESM